MIQLRTMTESEFLPYLDELYAGYADEQVQAGSWPAGRALELAKAEIHEMLPEGLATQKNYLYSQIVTDEPSPVGVIWILIREQE